MVQDNITEDGGVGGESPKTFEELRDLVTRPERRLFLEQFPKFKYIQPTAAALNLGGSAVSYWLSCDKAFRDAFEMLKKIVVEDTIRIHEENIDKVCLAENTPAQSRIFGSLVRLRAEAPGKYRENQQPDVKLAGDIIVKLSVPAYTDTPQLPEAIEVKGARTKQIGSGRKRKDHDM